MKIGIMSDTHDNKENILKAIEIFNSEKVDKVFHAGDIVSVNSADLFRALDAEMIITFGNCDLDRSDLRVILNDKAEFYDEFYDGKIGNKKIFMVHKPNHEDFYSQKDFDLIIHGHTHRLEMKNLGDSVLINPGEVVGRRTGRATIVIYDLDSSERKVVDLKDC